jgi:hypothetical protein
VGLSCIITVLSLEWELALQLALGPVLLATRGYGTPEARRPYRRAEELAVRLGNNRARFGATWGLWITTHGGGQEDEERLRHLGDLVQIARIGSLIPSCPCRLITRLGLP